MTNIVSHPSADRGERRRPRGNTPDHAPACRIPVPLGSGAMAAPARAATLVRTACSPELAAAAEAAVDTALATPFTSDPLLGPGLSQLNSMLSSVVKRHGTLIEAAITEALERSDRYLVLRHVAMPITEPTQEMMRKSSAGQLHGTAIDLHGTVAQTVFLDLVVIDLDEPRAIVAEVKRGGGKSEMRKIHQVEWILRAAQLQGRSFIASLGFQVAEVRAVLIDVYARAGYAADLTVTGTDLDTLFGVPVTDALEAVTGVLAARLRAVVPGLLEVALANFAEAEGARLRAPGPR